MSRRRWIMLVAPPLLVAIAAVPGLAGEAGLRAGATPPDQPRSIAACPAGESMAQRAAVSGRPVSAGREAGPSGRAAAPGTWWRTDASIDATGSLDGWILRFGAPGASNSELRIPAASTVTGPAGGRIVVASEPVIAGGQSIIRIVDAAAGCAAEIHVAGRIVRRAVSDPGGDGVLAHLLGPAQREDLGVWRIGADGRADRLIEPLADSHRAAVGMDRAWVTDLRFDVARERLAVQSCHPVGCVTRILDLGTGEITVLDSMGQGAIVGFSGHRLVTWGACQGLPCPIIAWSTAAGSAGASSTLAAAVAGAALSGDGGLLAVLLPGPDDRRDLVSIDLRTGAARPLDSAGTDDVPLSGAAGQIAGLETTGASVAIGHAGRAPTARFLDETAPSFVLPDSEVQP